MYARPLHEHLHSQDALSRLTEHVRLIGRMQRAYEKFLPPELTQVSRVLNVKQGVVVVSASSGAVAHRLKQLLPSARVALSESVGEVTEIRVKVQAFDPPRIPARPAPRPVSQNARRSIEAGAAALDADSPLKQALQQLIRKAESR